MKAPSTDGHFKVSAIKSFIRIVAAVCLVCNSLIYSGVLFLVAEILGIVEELV